MPKVNLAPDRQAPMKRLLRGYIHENGETEKEAYRKVGCCFKTFDARMKEPYTMTLETLLDFGRKFHIPIEELRAAIRY